MPAGALHKVKTKSGALAKPRPMLRVVIAECCHPDESTGSPGESLVVEQPQWMQAVDRADERRMDAVAQHAAEVIGHRPGDIP